MVETRIIFVRHLYSEAFALGDAEDQDLINLVTDLDSGLCPEFSQYIWYNMAFQALY
jgi:hypothetical protein